MIGVRSRPTRTTEPPPITAETITVTSIDDRAHEVRETELAVALTRRDGSYQALCGQTIIAAPMVMPDGRPCQPCAAIQDRIPARRHARLLRAWG